jgi:hypothetical protein
MRTMKRFEIITEADARTIEAGSSVTLAPGGHITPLALDTLKARRVTVVRDLLDSDLASLAPPAVIRAAMCTDRTLARYAREHNGANVLALGATLVSVDAAAEIVQTFLDTPMGEARYIRRLAKIRNLERTR